MNNPIAKFYQWQLSSGALDGWTSYHLAAGLFIAKIAQWLGSSDFWAVMWVVIIGVAWEIFEYIVEGTEETYGTKEKWAWNTGTDLFVEIAAAWWMVLQEKVVDIETLNYLGYGEVIEISLWIAVMYVGKGFIDEFFNRRLK